MKGGPKQIQLQAANQLLSAIRNQSQACYQRVCRSLEAWDRDEQDKLCYQRIQEVLKTEPHLVRALNVYVEEDVQLKYNKSTQEMIDDYMRDLHLNNPKAFERAYDKLSELQREGVTDDNRINDELIELFRDEPEVQRRFVEICSVGKEQEHIQEPPKKRKEKPQPAAQPYRLYEERNRKYAYLEEEESRNRMLAKESATTPMEELFRFRQQQAVMGPDAYESFVKIVYLFEVGVLSRAEVLAILPQSLFDSPETCELIRDSIEARDGERRRTTNVFKSLTDLNYSNSDRTTYSYVRMPDFYPIYCSGKIANPELNNILNVKWVILPVGSEHPNEFSVRPNNPYEDPLLRSEYDRYEFDLNLYRYRQTAKLLEKALAATTEAEAERLVAQAVSIGSLNIIYKNATKEQKEEIEVGLKLNRGEMAAAICTRVKHQIRELENLRANMAMKVWYEVSERNFAKSMDRRSHYFKHTERNINRPAAIVEALDLVRTTTKPTILNSFEGLSRIEHVNHYHAPKLQFPQNGQYNPFLVMYFENGKVLLRIREMMRDYVDTQPSTVDKFNVKRFFDGFLFPFVGAPQQDNVEPTLPAGFDYETAKQEIAAHLPIKEEDVRDHSQFVMLDVLEEKPPEKPEEAQKAEEAAPVEPSKDEDNNASDEEDKKIRVLKTESSVPYLPASNNNRRLFYGSQTSYTLLRLFYFLYEKILRAYELCHSFSINGAAAELDEPSRRKIALQRFNLFLSVFIGNLKSKEYSKLEETFREIFGQSGYIFFSIVKLFEGVFKAAQACVCDGFTSELVRLYYTERQAEEIYFFQANQMSLLYPNSGRIIRMVASPDGLLCFNLLQSIYRGWFADKKDQKEQPAWSRTADRMELYLMGKKGQHHYVPEDRRKTEVVVRNNHEYTIAPKTLQLVSFNEDFLCKRRKQQPPVRKSHLKEAKRASKLRSYLSDCLIDSTPGQL